jgi:hypothetical protein
MVSITAVETAALETRTDTFAHHSREGGRGEPGVAGLRRQAQWRL